MCLGCAQTQVKMPYDTASVNLSHGIYHTVSKGQTLWQISKAYDVDIKHIIEVNNIDNPSLINTGRDIFIPGARKPAQVMSIQPEFRVSEKGYVWPVRGTVICYYGSISDDAKNKGIDISAKQGDNVLAARSGRVVFVNDKVKGMGKTVIIEHPGNYSTLYAYNMEILVQSGDYVKQGQAIAIAGQTGRAKQPSLHFEIRKGHEPQNPYYYLP